MAKRSQQQLLPVKQWPLAPKPYREFSEISALRGADFFAPNWLPLSGLTSGSPYSLFETQALITPASYDTENLVKESGNGVFRHSSSLYRGEFSRTSAPTAAH